MVQQSNDWCGDPFIECFPKGKIFTNASYTPVWAIFSRNLNFDLNGFPIFEMLRCFKRKSKF
jgi:hypothetical protein